MMIETTQSIINHQGQINLPLLLAAAEGRCVAAHFGTYDYTAGCNITAAHQHMLHPACDFAKNMMQVSFAGTGIWLSDGATNIMPVAPHRFTEGGAPLTPEQIEENREVVHRAWKLHYDHIQHSLTNAFYQGWDLHPAQLPTRYAAVYAFFLESLEAASERLKNFVEKAAKATLVGDVFDDAATGQGLLNYFLRAINCGAITEAEAVELSGLTLPELRSASFVKISRSSHGTQKHKGRKYDAIETCCLYRFSNGIDLDYFDCTKNTSRRSGTGAQDRALCADYSDRRYLEAHAEGPASARKDYRGGEAARSVVPATGLEWQRGTREETSG